MFKLSLRVFLSFFRLKLGSFFFMLVGIFAITLGFIFIFSRGMIIYQEESEFNCETKTVIVTTKNNFEISREELSHFLFNNGKFPKIQELLVTNYETDTIGHYSVKEFPIAIPYGRYFSLEELNGSHVILLSDAYLSQVDTLFLIDMINKSLKIDGFVTTYQVIGRYNATILGNPLYSQEVIIPFNTYLHDGFPINYLKIIYSEKPTKQQILYLQDFFQSNNGDHELTLPKKVNVQAIKGFLQETASHFIILIVCYITLMKLLKYWIDANHRKLYIYYICGCSSKKVLLLILLNSIYLYAISSIISFVVYRLLETYFSVYKFVSVLSLLQYCVIYFIILIGTISTTWVMAALQLKKFNIIRESIY